MTKEQIQHVYNTISKSVDDYASTFGLERKYTYGSEWAIEDVKERIELGEIENAAYYYLIDNYQTISPDETKLKYLNSMKGFLRWISWDVNALI